MGNVDTLLALDTSALLYKVAGDKYKIIDF